MFNLQQIDVWLDKLYKERKNKNYSNMIRYYSELEKNMSISKCPIKNMNDNFDASLFKELQDEDFANPYLGWVGECFINSLTTSDDDKFFINQKIKNHIVNLKKIGVDGAHGFAFLSDYKSGRKTTKQLFVIKSAISEDQAFDESRHEVIIGFELNKLRSKIPNFAYVYGGFTCGLPMIINRKAENWCSANGNVNYVVYEFINNNTRFQDYTSNCTTEEFLEKYLQILNSLNLAYKEMDFTHYDLHNDNVLMRIIEGQPKLAIKYTYPNNRVKYHLTESIMTIIDLGFAHLKKDKKIDIGNPAFMAAGVFPNQSNIYVDAYKLLGFCMLTMKSQNYPVYRSLFPLMGFFDKTDSVNDIIDRGRQDLFVCPRVRDDNLDKLINFITSNYNTRSFLVDYPPRGYKVVICEDCKNMKDVINMFEKHPYEDILERIFNHGKEDIDKGEFLKARNSKLLEIDRQEAKINKLLDLVSSTRLDQKQLFSLTYMRGYKKYLSDLAKLIDLKDRMKYNILLINKASKLYGEEGITTDSYSSILKKVRDNYRNMLSDADKLETEGTRPITSQKLKSNPIFKWWWEEERRAFAQ